MRDAIVVGGAVMNELDYAHPPLPQVRAIIQRALEEDIGWGDVTTDNSVPADQRSRGVLLAKQEGVLCGGRVFAETLAMVNAAVTVDLVLPEHVQRRDAPVRPHSLETYNQLKERSDD